MPRPLLLLLLLPLLAATDAKPEAEAGEAREACPRRCACYVPTEVHCTFRSLTSLPAGIPRHVERVNLGFNSIRALPAAALAGMRKLELLLLHGNEIEEIPDGALADLGALQVLKLSYNRLRALTPGSLRGAWRLVRLHLDHNRLATLDPEALLGLTSLRLLQLEGNALTRLPPGALATFDLAGDPGLGAHFRVSTLRHLYLGGNALTSLPPALLPAAPLLETLALQGNPWACDCVRARWLREWAAGVRGVLRCRKDKAQEGGSCATCAGPAHFRSQELRALTAGDVTCARPALRSPLRGPGNGTLGGDVAEDDVTEDDDVAGAGPAPWRLALNLTDAHGNCAALACDAAVPRVGRALTDVRFNQSEAEGAGLRVEATVTLDLACAAAEAAPGDDVYGRVWRLLAYYSDVPVSMAAEPEVATPRPEVPGPPPETEPRTGSYAQDAAAERSLYFTGVRAQVTATPAWLLRPRFRLRLDRKRTSASRVRLSYEAPVAETVLPGRGGRARGDDVTPWVAIDRDDPEAEAAIAVEGAEARLACDVTVAPGTVVHVQWRLPDGTVLAAAAAGSRGDGVTPRVFAGSDGSLHFRPARREDSGRYVCSARAGSAEDRAARRLVVTSREAEGDGGDVITVRRSPGDALTLPCEDATGSAAALGWVLPGGRLLLRPRRGENASLGGDAVGASVGPDGSLSIPRLRAADAGDFRCVAAGPAGRDEFAVRVALGDDVSGGDGGDSEDAEASGMRPDAVDVTRNRKSRPGRRKLRLGKPEVRSPAAAEGPKPDVVSPLAVPQQPEPEVAIGAPEGSLEPQAPAPAEHRRPEETTSASAQSPEPEVGTPSEPKRPEVGSPAEGRRGFEPRRRQRVHVSNPRVHPERWAHILARVRGRNLPAATAAAADVTPATPTAPAEAAAAQLQAVSGNPEVTAKPEIAEPEVTAPPEVTEPEVAAQEEEGDLAYLDFFPEPWVAGSDVTRTHNAVAAYDVTVRAGSPQSVTITSASVPGNAASNVTEEAESESTVSPPPGFEWLAPTPGRGFPRSDVTADVPGPTLPVAGHGFRFPPGSDSGWQGLHQASGTSGPPESRPPGTNFRFSEAPPTRKSPGRRKSKGRGSTVTSGSQAPTSGSQATPTSLPGTTHRRRQGRKRLRNRGRPPPHPTSGPPGSPGPLLGVAEARFPVSTVPATPTAKFTTPGRSGSSSIYRLSTVTSEPSVVTVGGGAEASADVRQVLVEAPPTSAREHGGGGARDAGSGVTRVIDVTSDAVTPSDDITTPAMIDAARDVTTGAPGRAAPPPSTSVSAESPTGGPEAPPPPSSAFPAQAPPLTVEQEATPEVQGGHGVTGVTMTPPRTSLPVPSPRPPEVPGARPPSPVTPGDPRHRFSGPPSHPRPPPWDELPRRPRPLPFPGGSLRFTLPRAGVTGVTPGPPPPPEVPHGHTGPRGVDPGPPGERPHIVTKSPGAVAVATNQDATLHCQATGRPTPRFTWTKLSTGAAMSSASHPWRFEVLTNGSLVIRAAQAQDGGTYACAASNPHGVDRAHVTLHVQAAPQRIRTAAVPEASRDVTAHVGDAVALECVARGSPAPQVTWVLPDGTRLGPGSKEARGGRVTVHGGGLRLHVRDVGAGDGGVYVCVAGNVAGVDSAAVQLRVLPPPRRSPGSEDAWGQDPRGRESHAWPVETARAPQDEATLTVRPGTSVRMPCPPASPHAVRWVLPDGTHVRAVEDAARDGNVAVFPNGTLLIRHVGPGDAGRYSCVTSDPAGRAPRRTVVLSVPHAPASPARITEASPPRTRVRQGGELRLRCVARGDPQPRVLWRLPSRRLLDVGSSPDPRATVWPDGSLSVASVTQRDAGDYVCIARNTAGDDYVALTVDVHADSPSPPRRIDRIQPGTPLWLPRAVEDGKRHAGIAAATAPETAATGPTSGPGHAATAMATVDVNYGEEAALPCHAARADGAPQDVTWSSPTRKAIPADAVSPHGKYRIRADGTLAVLNAQRADGGNYTCVARTRVGKTTKSTTWLRVTVHAPRIQRNPGADVVAAAPGERVSIPCRAEGVPAPRVLWSVPRGVLLPAPWHSARMSIHADGTLEIAEAREADTGWLECVALNVGGEDRMRLRLTVAGATTRDHGGTREVATDAVTATAGHTISLRCPGIPQGSPPPPSTWTLPDGTVLRAGQAHARFSHGAAGVLHVSALSPGDAGTYRCTDGVIALAVEAARPDPADDPGTPSRVSGAWMPVVRAMPGSTLRVACHGGPSGVMWQLPDGTRVTPSAARPPRVSVDVHGTLTLRGATARDAGIYRCASGHAVVGSAYVRVR